jgi:uncharacterized RDD family membrane protein YckC
MTDPTASVPPPPAAWQAPPPEESAGPAPGVEFAPHGARLISYILDSIILTIALIVFFVIIAAVIGAAGSQSVAAVGVGVMIIGFLVISFGYFPWFWMRGGQTPGMKPFALYVVDDRTGGRISGGQAVLRVLGYIVNSIALYIGFAWILIDKRRRGWHDLIASTVVIKR